MPELKKKIFEETLTQAYDSDQYVQFLRELLNDVALVAPNREIKPYNTFSSAIDHYRHIGTYVGCDQNKVALFSVCLHNKNNRNVENARSMQRGFVKTLLENSDCAGALVSFYTKDDPDKWRLSLVRMDYEFSKGKISEKLTPAKRFSYLVGKGEPCHTAQERLYPIFASDEFNPSLDELEDAFSVEAVTDEFFAQYRDKYLDLKDYLDANPTFRAESESRGFDSEQFAKKLMGQIVFLYFIQKKGWLGVDAFPARITERAYKSGFYRSGSKPKELMPLVYKQGQDGQYHRDGSALLRLSPEDETTLSTLVKGDAWGEGPKDFMRQIFIGCNKSGKNFFDDYLEPLFYTGLNQNRGENAFFPPLHRRVPFLNGGLFEEMDGYDWRHNNFSIPNEMFSNEEEKGKREADGILDIFDRFNFTMAEDEPMEREVAIDPEMLGKVFENLLDVRDRKSKGAFYTPREIVHYMCQESLIHYLAGEMKIPVEDIRKFILYGEYFRDEDTKKTLPVENETGRVLTGDEIYHRKYHMEFDKNKPLEIPEAIFSYQQGVNRLPEMDDLLADVKVADIAVGSGAFPLGMLTEIVKARETITTYMVIEMNSRQRLDYRSQRSSYWMKRETIKNCIFACDIEASATDITKLRLWLSLVIDNVINDQEDEMLGYSTKPRELPNLDCNIICGNSLTERFYGIDLLTENFALGNESANRQITPYDEKVGVKIQELIELQSQLYDEKDRVAKSSLKDQIQDIYNEIVLEQLMDVPGAVDTYFKAIPQPSQPFVLWQLYFPKVFRDKGGFDIVIGNPPYIQLQKTINEKTGEKLGDQYQDLKFSTFAKTGDIYCLFYEKAFHLLHQNGILSFITSNKWMRAGYGEKLRAFLERNTNPIELIDFAGQKVFESATVDVNILIFKKQDNAHSTMACIAKDARMDNLNVFVMRNSSVMSFDSDESWTILSPIEQSIKRKIEEIGTPLKDWNISINYGIKTGFNDAFIINGAKKDELIAADPKSAEIIRPILRGRDIKRYGYTFADLWLINVHNGIKEKNVSRIKIEDYPAIKEHLDTYYEKLAKRADKGDTPYNLRNCAYMDDFFGQKISFAETMRIHRSENSDRFPRFALIDEGYFQDKTCFMITGPDLYYILAIINSSLSSYYIHKNVSVLDTGGFLMQKIYVENLPIPKASDPIYNTLSELAKNIVQRRKLGKSTSDYENQIDTIVNTLFNFNDAEIDYITNIIGN